VSSVEAESITTISSSRSLVSMSADRTRLTTSPTVAASLRAGTTRLTVVALAAFASSSASSEWSHHALVFASNQASRSWAGSDTSARLLRAAYSGVNR